MSVVTKLAQTFEGIEYWLAWDEPAAGRGVGIGSSEQEATDNLNAVPPTDVLGAPDD